MLLLVVIGLLDLVIALGWDEVNDAIKPSCELLGVQSGSAFPAGLVCQVAKRALRVCPILAARLVRVWVATMMVCWMAPDSFPSLGIRPAHVV